MTDITIFQFEHVLKSWRDRFHKGKLVKASLYDDSEVTLQVDKKPVAIFPDMQACYIYMRDEYVGAIEAKAKGHQPAAIWWNGLNLSEEKKSFDEEVKKTRWSDEDAAKVANAFKASFEKSIEEVEITITVEVKYDV